MKTKARSHRDEVEVSSVTVEEYERELRLLQIELVKLQRHFLCCCSDRILVIFEGRDASGKDGTIKRIVEHLSPRETRVVALGKPSDRDLGSWYFQRYVAELPAAGEFTLFNRSWYNRAGVEHVMGFCTDEEHEEFLSTAPEFEGMLVRSGIRLIKYYLDITKDEQKRRIESRRRDPLKQWKVSPIDEKAVALWKKYSKARNEMLARTNHVVSWNIVRADDKRVARLNVIKDLLTRLHYADKDTKLIRPNSDIVFPYSEAHLLSGAIAK
ncbi:polyphosphate kinase 2 [Cupriavidus consociatus]|uniref:polyphosphate kinase 2 n=1 Tax=Cupriavidus consociatus TaxID=2821357 RepID=UPI001AE24FAA|nr:MULTISPECIES: polyphosphate kinase 2 [unclassified Cupriavidus]MBP0624972.1 polyphosphate kinase 2 [Cupriavidus sp. LEh25]MDK2661705.1 polyphosphate kinase 2 [Cupriavidus sp. LEh21]